MFEVDVSARAISPFVELIGEERLESIARRAESVRALLAGHRVWNVNSTAAGGGVAEMLRSQLRYARGLGVDVRWVVIEGTPEFFRVTKRLHNALHGSSGDGTPLGREQAELYDAVTEANAAELQRIVRPGDVVICHDPQTAGLVPRLVRALGARVVWRCHIGSDCQGGVVDEAWEFLRPHVEGAPLAVFSRAAYVPAWLPRARAVVLPPNIDPFSAKNQWLPVPAILGILAEADLVAGDAGASAPVFVGDDGGTRRVARQASVVRDGLPPGSGVPLVVQVSRWDRMKDPVGVLAGFAKLAQRGEAHGAHLVLAGPSVRGVADDPEGPEVLAEVKRAFSTLPSATRSAVHLAEIPMDDVDENAAIVNALQRHATIIVQKSLREGFGLTVTEAMWKRRPVVASAVGGIQDQLRDGVEGLLLRDPTDAGELAAALARLLESPELAAHLGDAGYERVRSSYLVATSLERWADLVCLLLEPLAGAAAA